MHSHTSDLSTDIYFANIKLISIRNAQKTDRLNIYQNKKLNR